jgi:hypothetical protein
MVNLPPGIDASSLLADFFSAAAPFVGVSFLIACGFIIINILTSIEVR